MGRHLSRSQRRNRPKRAPRPERTPLDRAKDEVRRLRGVVARREAKLSNAKAACAAAIERAEKLEEETK